MNIPSKVLEKAVEEISNLPGIGKRTALRMALFMLRNPKSQTEKLSLALSSLVQEIRYCQNCHNFSDHDLCETCENAFRKDEIICVVEDVRDVMAIEASQHFNGKYHVLGGKISPIEGISPQDLNIDSLVKRVEKGNILEIIFALSATIEGDTTMYYIYKKLQGQNITFTTIARGIGVGDELEYTDVNTIARSLDNRIEYHTTAKF